MAAVAGSTQGISEVDITALLQPRQGYLWKLGGGQETGSKWNRRWFVLRDNVLMYFQAPRDFLSFRDKPNGVVLLDEANVRLRDDKAARPFTFVLSHPGGESVVLAAESEKEMHEWMQAVRTSRMCIADPSAAGMTEEQRRVSAEAELESARSKKSDPNAELARIEEELEAVQQEHRQLEVEKESAEKQLKELMARFKLRKALLHWRHRKLTLSFRSLVTMVFRTRIEEAKRLKEVRRGTPVHAPLCPAPPATVGRAPARVRVLPALPPCPVPPVTPSRRGWQVRCGGRGMWPLRPPLPPAGPCCRPAAAV